MLQQTKSKLISEKTLHLNIGAIFLVELSTKNVVYRQTKNLHIIVKPIHSSLRSKSKIILK